MNWRSSNFQIFFLEELFLPSDVFGFGRCSLEWSWLFGDYFSLLQTSSVLKARAEHLMPDTAKKEFVIKFAVCNMGEMLVIFSAEITALRAKIAELRESLMNQVSH